MCIKENNIDLKQLVLFNCQMPEFESTLDTCTFAKSGKNYDHEDHYYQCLHSVPERIWIKGSYPSQWLPQGERGPPKESKSGWIEILHGGSLFTLWFCENQKISKIFGSLQNFFLL